MKRIKYLEPLADGIDYLTSALRNLAFQVESELAELQLRRKYLIDQGISKNTLDLLDQLSQTYERKYLSDHDWIWKEVANVKKNNVHRNK